MVEFVNLTPHPIDVVVDGVVVRTIQASGDVARVDEHIRPAGELAMGPHRFPVNRHELGEVIGLPPPRAGVVYIVARLVSDRAQGRDDVVFPSNLVRDARGAVIGCAGFGRVG